MEQTIKMGKHLKLKLESPWYLIFLKTINSKITKLLRFLSKKNKYCAILLNKYAVVDSHFMKIFHNHTTYRLLKNDRVIKVFVKRD